MTEYCAEQQRLREILAGTSCVMLDFDGPVCAVFADLGASTVADRALDAIRQAGYADIAQRCQTNDPLELLSLLAGNSPELVQDVEAVVRGAEIEAVSSATPTPGAVELIERCHASGRSLCIVSNNADSALHDYLAEHGLTGKVDAIAARRSDDVAHLKPDTRLLKRAAEATGTSPTACTLIGDSPSDIKAAHAFGAHAIGYANKPGKFEKLTNAGADAMSEQLEPITSEL
ncbi:Haloacid dehalogenase-like hydrolase [Actinopolyspora xinjiangensis]|uniref:Haloacid dehalogenase-like hydrolase n=1 Tax=Actinopolyspora xinjiangensis TaxID=405564 RepID=A0A1H0V705_9ACTN|nr:HAD family phosphatase [Actinopolyspora xinjiangensis]SDP74177.1 Haloacid dehalogenase-like hydrolase [Actinopolyspora xinjiangensis]